MNSSTPKNKLSAIAKEHKPVDMLHWHEPTVEHPGGYTAPNTPNPVFIAAVEQYERLSEILPDVHPVCHGALMIMLELAPLERQTELLAKAIEFGLIPEATGYLEDGTPIYSMESFGRRAGLTEDESQQAFEDIMAMRAAAGLDECILHDAEDVQLTH